MSLKQVHKVFITFFADGLKGYFYSVDFPSSPTTFLSSLHEGTAEGVVRLAEGEIEIKKEDKCSSVLFPLSGKAQSKKGLTS